jgi:proteasome lid subunit RPN8/RPN11
LEISRIVLDDVIAHAREEAPRECCGLLLGASDRIQFVHRARNADTSPRTRFLIDPRDHLAAIRRAREIGLDVVGFYHSHPSTAARPSPSDTAEATYAGYAYAIVSLASDQPDVRFFRRDTDRFVEDLVKVAP